MPNTRFVLTALVVLALAQPAHAADASSLKGLWNLVSYDVEKQSDGSRQPVMGSHPTGKAIFTPEGQVFFVLTGEGRKPATTDAQRAQLLNTVVAYAGKYRIEGDQWITSVEVAWNPEWVGTEQRRTFKIDGKRLSVLTPWREMPNWKDLGTTRSIITFERAN